MGCVLEGWLVEDDSMMRHNDTTDTEVLDDGTHRLRLLEIPVGAIRISALSFVVAVQLLNTFVFDTISLSRATSFCLRPF